MSNKKILVVDDDADTLLGYKVLLKAHHYDTVLAGDGVSAIREGLEHQPDLVILDLVCPPRRLNGVGMVPREHAALCDPCHRRVRPRPSRKQATRAKGGGQGLCAEAVE